MGLILDSVATPVNVGSILRTAAAMRVDDAWICGQTADPAGAGAAKTAMGSERFVDLHRIEDPTAAVAAARAAGYRIIGLELADTSQPIHEVDLSGDVCLVAGHEQRGLSAPAMAAVDLLVYVPQLGRVGSLNVANATAIALYEIRRQGWAAPAP